jgi:GR25 family glycosyltransferase involved in LPS biosynthesis
VLILEDDIALVNGFQDKLNAVLNELPSGWNMLHLNGSSHYRHLDYSSLVWKVKRLSGAFGYLVNSNFYDTLIELLSRCEKPCDGHYMDIQKDSMCFLSKEKLVKHLDGYSVRAEKVVAYPQLR